MVETSPDDRVEVLNTMLSYLETRLSHQVANASQVDTKVTVQLTVSAAPVVFVGQLLVAVQRFPSPCVQWLTVTALVALVVGLACMLRVALRVLDVNITLPGVATDAFRRITKDKSQPSEQTLRQLVGNATDAYEENKTHIKAREPNTKQFKFWSHWSLASSLAAVVLLTYSYIAALPQRGTMEAGGTTMSNTNNTEAAPAPAVTVQEQPTPAPAPSEPVSVTAEPTPIQYGRDVSGSADDISVAARPQPINFGKAATATRDFFSNRRS